MTLFFVIYFTSQTLVKYWGKRSAAPPAIRIRKPAMETKVINKRMGRIIADGLMVAYFLFALFPIFWMVLMSLKSTDQLFTTQFVFKPTLENYHAILFGDPRAAAGVVAKQEFPRNFMNSVIISSGSVIVSLIVGVPAAYALARYNFKAKENLAFSVPVIPLCA